MPALRGFALLLVLQTLGEVLTHAFGWLIPGPVLGLMLLFAALFWAPLRAPIEAAAQVLLQHLSLLFVPVGAGIILHTGLLAQYGLQLVLTIVLSTVVGIAVTAGVLHLLLQRWPPQDAE
ncbi:MAG: CidA/LrgA family protein [Leptothrix sp. (in: b-proteobacteria)]